MGKLRAAGMAALVVAALGAAPAAAAEPAPEETFPAVIDCGSGPVDVVSGADLFEPLVAVDGGKKYKPTAWSVTVFGELMEFDNGKKRKRNAVDCSYDDGIAVGTVTVKKA